jgi:hypothetical protein
MKGRRIFRLCYCADGQDASPCRQDSPVPPAARAPAKAGRVARGLAAARSKLEARDSDALGRSDINPSENS